MSIHKRGKKWVVRYRDESGANRQETCETQGAAKAFQRKVDQRKADGDDVNPERSMMTVGQFYETVFLPARSNVLGSTQQTYARRWGSIVDPKKDKPWHVRKKWATVRLRDANSREAVLKWLGEMKRAGASDASAYRAHDLLMSIIGCAVEFEYLHRTKLAGTRPKYQPKRQDGVWLPEQIETIRDVQFFDGFDPHENTPHKLAYRWRRDRDRVAVSLMGYNGLRLGEAFHLPWTNVLRDDRKGIGHVVLVNSRVPGVAEDPEEQTKTYYGRTLDLNEHVRKDLMEWWIANGRPTTGAVLPVERGGATMDHLNVQSWRRWNWTSVLERSGLPYHPPKHLRHSCVSMWIREGRDVGTVADDAGHSIDVCIKTYRHAFKALRGAEPFDMTATITAARANPDVRTTFATGTDGGAV